MLEGGLAEEEDGFGPFISDVCPRWRLRIPLLEQEYKWSSRGLKVVMVPSWRTYRVLSNETPFVAIKPFCVEIFQDLCSCASDEGEFCVCMMDW